jgi:hypothetical protein
MIILQIRSWEGRRTSLGRYPHELAFHGISAFIYTHGLCASRAGAAYGSDENWAFLSFLLSLSLESL